MKPPSLLSVAALAAASLLAFANERDAPLRWVKLPLAHRSLKNHRVSQDPRGNNGSIYVNPRHVHRVKFSGEGPDDGACSISAEGDEVRDTSIAQSARKTIEVLGGEWVLLRGAAQEGTTGAPLFYIRPEQVSFLQDVFDSSISRTPSRTRVVYPTGGTEGGLPVRASDLAHQLGYEE